MDAAHIRRRGLMLDHFLAHFADCFLRSMASDRS
jgi:hypothetical protein